CKNIPDLFPPSLALFGLSKLGAKSTKAANCHKIPSLFTSLSHSNRLIPQIPNSTGSDSLQSPFYSSSMRLNSCDSTADRRQVCVIHVISWGITTLTRKTVTCDVVAKPRKKKHRLKVFSPEYKSKPTRSLILKTHKSNRSSLVRRSMREGTRQMYPQRSSYGSCLISHAKATSVLYITLLDKPPIPEMNKDGLRSKM
ncbi:hypothetical protein AKJ16_DCAP23778, partial [Drosera capensis]